MRTRSPTSPRSTGSPDARTRHASTSSRPSHSTSRRATSSPPPRSGASSIDLRRAPPYVPLDREGVSIAAHVRTEGGHMSEGQAKIDALRSAGYQISPDLPEPYERVLKGL